MKAREIKNLNTMEALIKLRKFSLLIGLLCPTQSCLWLAVGGVEQVIERKIEVNYGRCIVEGNIILLPGQYVKPHDRCVEIHCLDDNMTKTLHCPDMTSPRGCRMADYVNVNAPFRKCCDRYVMCNGVINGTMLGWWIWMNDNLENSKLDFSVKKL